MKTRVTCHHWNDRTVLNYKRPISHLHAHTCPASNENSRSSSSMGYLEPRPPAQPSANGEQVFSPKDIQKKLMDKVSNLSSDTSPENEDAVKRAESGGGASTISASRSSQSLNSNGGGVQRASRLAPYLRGTVASRCSAPLNELL